MDQTLPAWVYRDRAGCGWQGVGNAGALGQPGSEAERENLHLLSVSPARGPTRAQQRLRHRPQPSPKSPVPSPKCPSPKARWSSLPVSLSGSAGSAGSVWLCLALPCPAGWAGLGCLSSFPGFGLCRRDSPQDSSTFNRAKLDWNRSRISPTDESLL